MRMKQFLPWLRRCDGEAARSWETRVGLVSMPPELLATMPSVFELLPNPERTWMIDLH
jgi:hypothetical protein